MKALLLTYVAAFGLVACITPSVVKPEERAVATSIDSVLWRSGSPNDVPGYYASVRVDGPMAAVLLRVYYEFRADGTYTGAALVDGTPAGFQVLSGRWQLTGQELQLDDAQPALVEVGEDLLRMSGAEGSVVLRRERTP